MSLPWGQLSLKQLPLGKELPNQGSFSKDKGQEHLLVTDTTTTLLKSQIRPDCRNEYLISRLPWEI